MSFSELLNHKCDIYHTLRKDTSPGYNLPASPTFSYPDAPDIPATPCHFNTKGGNLIIVQGKPQARLTASVKLVLPAGTDVRMNDKIVDCDTGIEYTAEVPRDIRGHHITVQLHRSGQQEPM